MIDAPIRLPNLGPALRGGSKGIRGWLITTVLTG
jgi:hypothetical protein